MLTGDAIAMPLVTHISSSLGESSSVFIDHYEYLIYKIMTIIIQY